jgi:hypothetical protein
MKKLIYLMALTCIVSMMAVSCEIDNYEGPNSTITGKFLDSATGELVGTDIVNGNTIGVYEQGWATEAKQTWNIMNTGEYTNNLAFAATYRIEFNSCNFYPFKVNDFVLNKGANTYDFTVTPYLRINNPSITYDANTKIVTATFNLEKGGADDIKLNEIRLFAFTDQWVGNYVKFAITSTSCYKKAPANVSATLSSGTYTLTMDVSANPTLFKTSRTYYFRIGALATVPSTVQNAGTIRHNYSPLVAIDIAR